MNKNITRDAVMQLCTAENSVIDFYITSWQIAGMRTWSASAHRVDDDTILIRTMIDGDLREWGVLDDAAWDTVKVTCGDYSDGNRVLRVAAGMRMHATYGDFERVEAD